MSVNNVEFVNKIFCGDCLEGMKKYLPSSSVDVIVTSPPYNIGVKYNSYHDEMNFEDYLDWMEKVGKECSRVLKDGGSFFFNIGDKVSDEFRAYDVAKRIAKNFRLQNTIHWIKSIAIPEIDVAAGHYKPVNSKRFLNNCHEYIFHFTKNTDVALDKLAIGVPYADKSNIGRYSDKDLRDRGNTWFIPYQTVKSSKQHPAAFPVGLPSMCIKLHGFNKDTLVLDPFMGIGSTALAAKGLGCKYVGFELDDKYVDITHKALAQTKLDLPT